MVSRLFNVGSCLLGAGLTAVFSLSLAQAQTVPYAPTYANAVPVSSTYSYAYPAVTYANNQYVVSAPVAQAYMAPSSVYAVAPTPTPCGVYGDYQSYLNQLIYYRTWSQGTAPPVMPMPMQPGPLPVYRAMHRCTLRVLDSCRRLERLLLAITCPRPLAWFSIKPRQRMTPSSQKKPPVRALQTQPMRHLKTMAGQPLKSSKPR